MSQPTKQCKLSGWGHYPVAECLAFRPERQRDIAAILYSSKTTLLARGQGRAYADAALNPDGVVLSERLNRFLEFDEKTGILLVQAGVTLAEIVDFGVPKGWMVPVLPGTRYVSIGGAMACNIHGKNHVQQGDIANHIKFIRIRLADGKQVECSPRKESKLFWATAGGMGMTGVIEEVSLKLKKIDSLSLKAETRKVSNIEQMVEAFEESRDSHEYRIGWIDHFAKGQSLGRGVFEKANHISAKQGGAKLSDYTPAKPAITVPPFVPSFILNRYSMALYNKIRFNRYTDNWKSETLNFDGFFHPLDGIKSWHRLYGKRGFFQYQLVIPQSDDVAKNLHELLEFIQTSGQFSFLAVLKQHGAHKGVMSFPIEGYSLALDFPNTPEVQKLQAELNQRVLALGGRVYLAKDALLSAELFENMYADALPKWRKLLAEIDPEKRFDSLMAKRLNFRGDAS